MKRFLTLVLAAWIVLHALSGCGCDDGGPVDLIFVDDSDKSITSVRLDTPRQSGGTQHADSSPLRRGESFGFETGGYPVTMQVYGEPVKGSGERLLATIILQSAPAEGECWYVVARDGENNSLTLSADTGWPEGVPEVTTGGGLWFPSGALILGVFLWAPLAVLAAVCVLTLDRLPPQRRRGLFALFFTLLGLAAVLFGGALALGAYGLAWRTWFQECLSVILWLAGLATGLLTVAYSGRWLTERGRTVKGAVTALCACCFASAMLLGTIVGGLWALGPGEQVVVHDGQTMILAKWIWRDTGCELYDYHGPLVRGDKPVLVDWDTSLARQAAVHKPQKMPSAIVTT